jgi:hypothetical protein
MLELWLPIDVQLPPVPYFLTYRNVYLLSHFTVWHTGRRKSVKCRYLCSIVTYFRSFPTARNIFCSQFYSAADLRKFVYFLVYNYFCSFLEEAWNMKDI